MQLGLLDVPIWRATDPATSKAAGQRKNADGSRALDRDRLLALIRARPGHTSMEYAQILIDSGWHWLRAYQVASKRISDLDYEIVPDDEPRLCAISGRLARTWRAV